MAQVQSPLRPLDLNKEKQQPKQKKREKLSSLCKTPPALIRNKIGKDYERGSCLGEGGFARCFQVKDEGGQLFAAKTVAKASIKNDKTRTKLLAEIKIHKSLSHPNVVKFVDCFEDDANVYILLEMCANQSLMDMVRQRRRLTEPEARFLIVQIIGAVNYMHRQRVIHRDLKLGNIFLDSQMNAKIGDFGLATLMQSDTDRKKTICGTPNYIAPEILYGSKDKGHSYEVDIWSIGIILYAMLFGKPPFQSKEVDTIYQRIKNNDYEYPEHINVSQEAKNLITDILKEDPLERPDLQQILEYDFFKGDFPAQLNPQSLTKTPTYRNLSESRSRENFISAQIACQLAAAKNGHSRAAASKSLNPVEITKAEAKTDSKVLPTSLSPASTKDKYKMVMVKKEQASEKPATTSGGGSRLTNRITRDLGQPARRHHQAAKPNSAIYVKATADTIAKALSNKKQTAAAAAAAATATTSSSSSSSSLSSQSTDDLQQAVFVSKWVDYSNKYGLSYQMSDSQVGVLFRDKITMIMDPETSSYQAFKLSKNNASMNEWVDKSVDPKDPSDAKRIKLAKNFYKYMQENLCRTESSTPLTPAPEPIYITQYNRQEEAIMFQLSTGTVQFNFPDHCKLIISCQGQQLDLIDPKRRITTTTMASAIANAKKMSGMGTDKYNLVEKLHYCQEEIEKTWIEMVSA